MDYSQIVQDAWHATLRHKVMWWLGMGVLGGGSIVARVTFEGFNVLIESDEELSSAAAALFESPFWRLWLEEYWWMAAIILLLFFILWIMVIVIDLIARSGLYYGANQARQHHPVHFGAMIQAGLHTFWRYVGFFIALALAKMAAVLGIAVSIISLIASVIGILFVLPFAFMALILTIPLAVGVEIFVIYSLQGMTIHRHGSIVTMQHTWQRLRTHAGDSVLAYIMMMVIQFVVRLVWWIVAMVIAAPFAILTYVAYTSDAPLGAVLSLLGGGTFLGVLWLAWKGIIQSFRSHYWHRVYTLCQ